MRDRSWWEVLGWRQGSRVRAEDRRAGKAEPMLSVTLNDSASDRDIGIAVIRMGAYSWPGLGTRQAC